MLPSSCRTLVRALTVSVIAHAALLLSVASPLPVRVDMLATTINVVMIDSGRGDSRKRVQAPAETPPMMPAKASIPDKSPKPVIRRRAVKQIVVPEKPAALVAEPQAPSITPDPRPYTTPPLNQTAYGGGGGGAAASPAASRAGVDADDMRQYRLSLATAARRFKRYPALARERGWEGATEVALKANALVSLPEVVLVNSSGRSILDEQALEMIRQAVRITMLPEGLKGRDFRILLPVKFSLDSDQ